MQCLRPLHEAPRGEWQGVATSIQNHVAVPPPQLHGTWLEHVLGVLNLCGLSTYPLLWKTKLLAPCPFGSPAHRDSWSSPGLFSLEWMLDTQILPSIHSSPASWLSGRWDGHPRVADPTGLCLQVSSAWGAELSRGAQEGDCVKAQGWSGMGSSHLPLLSLSGATATSNEEREHPDQKTEAKEPCQDQGLLRCEWRGGGHSQASESCLFGEGQMM